MTTDPRTQPEVLNFTTGEEWEHWLDVHHERRAGAWLRVGKARRDSGLIRIEDALDGALCFGWIDGQRRAFDESSFLQRYSPRRRRSTWSQVNVAKVEVLIAAGRMRPPGWAEIERARADGRWDAAYERQATAATPSELVVALAGSPVAERRFEAMSRSEKYAVALSVMRAVGAEARDRAAARAVRRLLE